MGERTFFSFRNALDWTNGWLLQLERGDEGLSIVKDKVYRNQSRRQLPRELLAVKAVDTAYDAAGRWYMLDNEQTVWRLDASLRFAEQAVRLKDKENTEETENVENAEGTEDTAIAIAAAQDSVVVLFGGGFSRLEAFHADKAQIRWQTDSWYGEKFHAFAIAVDHEGGVVAVATIGKEEQLQLLRFDVSGAPATRIPLLFTQVESICADEHPGFEFAMGAERNCFVLNKQNGEIAETDLRTNYSSLYGSPSIADYQSVCSICCSHDGKELWALVDSGQGPNLLFELSCTGEQARRGYAGNAKGGLLLPGQQCLYIWDTLEQMVYQINPVIEPAIWEPFGTRSGIWISETLDSGEDGTKWHRIVMDTLRLQDTQINIKYFASNDLEHWIGDERTTIDRWLAKEQDAKSKLEALEPLWSKPLKDADDALIHQAEGRYLRLCIELLGTVRHAPVIRSMELYFPKQSIADELPAIYQQDLQTSSFLTRYLSVFQTLLDDMEDSVEGVTRTLEANQAEGASLRWLLGWLGIEADDYWNDAQLRQLLKEAPMLYSMRGTKAALERLIAIYTGETPIILEYGQVKPLKENKNLGEAADRLYAAGPHMFNVLVKAEHADTEMKRVTLQQLIEAFKPAFASFKLIVLQPWVYMDLHSYLGMNTVLSEPDLLRLDGKSSMPHHTITIDTGLENRMDRHTRLGMNSRLE